MSDDVWLRCSACKAPIAYRAIHQVCSVSTCNRSRTRLVFCTVSCWDSHVATLRHREAWAVEARAPTRDEWEREQAEAADEPAPAPAAAPPRRVVGAPSVAPPSADRGGPALATVSDRDILIVVSKMKKYIKDRSGMNSSDAVADMISDHVRAICDEAIRAAAADGRKTVLDRDVPRKR